MNSSRVTLRAIAEAAGVTLSTVSRALRNDPQVAAKTITKIKRLAEKMGYRPDPALIALASYRSGKRSSVNFGKLAVLCHRSLEQGLPAHLDGQISGIRTRATQLGFETDVFQIGFEELEQRRLCRILYHRGIRGIMVTTLPFLPSAFDWEKFSVVAIGENAVPLRLNFVSYDHDEAIREVYQQVRARGYRRIGYCNLLESEERNRFLCFSAYLKYTHLEGSPSFPPLFFNRSNRRDVVAWVRAHKLDCMIATGGVAEVLQEAGYSIPGRIGVVGFTTPSHNSPDPDMASYLVDYDRMGAAAVEFLQSLMHQNERGVPMGDTGRAILLRGRWREGSTLRPLPPDAVMPTGSFPSMHS